MKWVWSRGEEEGNRKSRKSIVSHVTELRCLRFPETDRLKDSPQAKHRKGEEKGREKICASSDVLDVEEGC